MKLPCNIWVNASLLEAHEGPNERQIFICLEKGIMKCGKGQDIVLGYLCCHTACPFAAHFEPDSWPSDVPDQCVVFPRRTLFPAWSLQQKLFQVLIVVGGEKLMCVGKKNHLVF